MRIGLAFDLKEAGAAPPPPGRPGDFPGEQPDDLPGEQPDDLFEEYDPPSTVAAIEGAIAARGHEVLRLGGGRAFLERVLCEPVDFVFNISEGRGTFRGREGQVPSVLEMLSIPYSFSDPLTLGISLDKDLTKRLVAAAGVAVPPGWMVRGGDDLERLATSNPRFPLFAKPAFEGSSKGIRSTSFIPDGDTLRRVVPSLLRDYRQPILVETFVSGDEYTVGVVGNGPPQALGAMRIRPKSGPDPNFAYTIEVKRDWENRVAYDIPAPLPPGPLARLLEDAVRAFEALECRDVARVDFRMDGETPLFLEINPLPGLSPVYGDLPILARGHGLSYEEFMGRILDAGLLRCGLA
jgi:D-alanine-D-alanine ligase